LLDQAESLRRLLRPRQPAVLAFTAGLRRSGVTSIVANVAAALAAGGNEVLLLDQNLAPDNLAAYFRLRPRFELGDVIAGDRRLDQIALHAAAGVTLVPAVRGLQELAGLEARDEFWLADAIGNVPRRPDWILIDAAAGPAGDAVLRAAGDVAVVVCPGRASITAAYALIKRLAATGLSCPLRMLINRTRAEAQMFEVFDCLAGTAETHLGVLLDFVGILGHDDHIKQARRQNRCVPELFPDQRCTQELRRLADSLGARARSHFTPYHRSRAAA
jgi:flagellar biosynthesis protein FlhG